jgi:hypothetical protein
MPSNLDNSDSSASGVVASCAQGQMSRTIKFDWPTCRVEGCENTAHRIIDVYEAGEWKLPQFKRREGLCLIHNDRL